MNDGIRFSIFDWLDESGRGYAQTYDERLKLLEIADKAGYYAYHLAEHHGTSLSSTPSPSLFLSAVAQRTSRLRLGALTYVLPLYNPLRLLEELCMLDQLSHGRLEVGIGGGGSPHERLRFGVAPEESRGRFEEVLRLLVMGFTTGELTFAGKYYQYDGVKTRFRPYQQPYPPMWYPTSHAESIPWLAGQGFSLILSLSQWPNVERVAELLRLYRAEYAAHRSDAGRVNAHVAEPNIGISAHVHVAETDAKAREQARTAFADFWTNFTRRYVEIGQADKYPAHDFDQMVDAGTILAGSPDTVRTVLAGHLAQTGANYFLGSFTFGSLPFAAAKTSLELFAREVIPGLG